MSRLPFRLKKRSLGVKRASPVHGHEESEKRRHLGGPRTYAPQYPVENAYQQYLTSHNGYSNAYTAMTSTVYFFDVAADALEGALDRFAGFFIEPLFNEVSH